MHAQPYTIEHVPTQTATRLYDVVLLGHKSKGELKGPLEIECGVDFNTAMDRARFFPLMHGERIVMRRGEREVYSRTGQAIKF